MANVVGIMRKEKNGKTATLIFFTEEFSDYDNKVSQCDGKRSDSIFTYMSFPDIKVGSKIEPIYTKGYEDKAVLKDIKVVQ